MVECVHLLWLFVGSAGSRSRTATTRSYSLMVAAVRARTVTCITMCEGVGLPLVPPSPELVVERLGRGSAPSVCSWFAFVPCGAGSYTFGSPRVPQYPSEAERLALMSATASTVVEGDGLAYSWQDST